MKNRILILSGLLLASPLVLASEDPEKLCKNAAALYADDDIDGALEEAKWCLEALEQLKQAKLVEAFPETVKGWKRGDVNANKGMGMSVIETRYEKDGKTINVSLTGGMEGLGAFAQMGLAAGGNKVRIQRKTAYVMGGSDSPELMMTLEGGKLLKLDGYQVTVDDLTAVASELPLKAFE